MCSVNLEGNMSYLWKVQSVSQIQRMVRLYHYFQLTSTLLLSKQRSSIYEPVTLKALEMLVTEIGDIFP